MKTLYLDCFAGIAGDMFLGALLDLGADRAAFENELRKLNLPGYALSVERVRRGGFAGTDVHVLTEEEGHDHHHDHGHEDSHEHCHHHDHGHEHHCHEEPCCKEHHEHVHEHEEHDHVHSHHHVHRGLKEIREIITNSALSSHVKEQTLSAFQLLAEAEGSVHGISPEEVHFHEVGAIDSIVDITGAFILLELLGIEKVCASPVNVGSGTVRCAHGIMPVPAPATARLLEGIPVFANGEPMERTTPTGALLLRQLVSSFGAAPAGVIRATGYGFGDRQSDLPNMLRVTLIDEGASEGRPYSSGAVAVLETNIDDMNPQDYQNLEELLFENGALDVFFTSIMMKKMRPAVRLTCVAPLDQREKLGEIVLRNSSSIGIRWSEVSRMTLRRKIVPFESSLGVVAMKLSSWGSEVIRATPEYEDVRRIAREKDVPVSEVRQIVLNEYHAAERAEGETHHE